MQGQAMALAAALLGLAAPAVAQSEQATEEQRTAEQFIETARAAYTVDEPEVDPCPVATSNEIVVCRRLEEDDSQRLPSPTERANAAGERPPDRIPSAPDVFGLPPCKSYAVCVGIGRAPPPVYIIDFSTIPEALTPEEAALVFRAEDLAEDSATQEEASPTAAP